MKHYLLTRYNTQLYSGKGFFDKHGRHINEYADEWMKHRFELFKNICLPSVEKQINQNFEWLVFLDKATPEQYIKQIEALQLKRKFKILFAEEEARDESLKYIKDDIGQRVCITSRIDNDDAIRYDFIETIQEMYKKNIGNSLVFKKGTYFDIESKRQSIHTYPRNPFLTLIKPSNDINDVWSVEHGNIDSISREVIEIDCEPMWLSTVHKYNRKNNLRGKEVHKSLRWLEYDFSIKGENNE